MEKPLRVLVVDDASFMRKALSQILEADPGISVPGAAKNGLEALTMIRDLKPDVVTMDIDMPVMDGLTAIRHIMIEMPVPIVALSSLVTDGAVTFEALRLGVVDFVPKPSGAVSRDIDISKQVIIDRIKVAKTVNLDNVRRVRLPDRNKYPVQDVYTYRPLEYLVTVGTTLSGPNTVIRLLANLTPTLPAAILVVQEVSPRIIDSFVHQFNEHVPWRIEVAKTGIVLEQGVCYISSNEEPASVGLDGNGRPCLVTGPKMERPLDRLFSSAADVFGRHTIGVLLTGLGEDGAQGFDRINKVSGVTLAQDSLCCVYPNLVHHAVTLGVVDRILDETLLADAIEDAIDVINEGEAT